MTGARRRSKQGKRNVAKENDDADNLPFGGKVRLARRRKPDGWLVIALEVRTQLFSLECRPSIRYLLRRTLVPPSITCLLLMHDRKEELEREQQTLS